MTDNERDTRSRSSSCSGSLYPTIPQHRAIFPRRRAECFFVAAAEMSEIGKAAGQRNLRNAVAGAQRVGEIAAAFLQPPLPDPVADGRAFGVKEVLQIARGNADKLGDLLGVERVIVQIAFDDQPWRERSARCAPKCRLRRFRPAARRARPSPAINKSRKAGSRSLARHRKRSTPSAAQTAAPANRPGSRPRSAAPSTASVRPIRRTIASRGMCSTSCSNPASKFNV